MNIRLFISGLKLNLVFHFPINSFQHQEPFPEISLVSDNFFLTDNLNSLFSIFLNLFKIFDRLHFNNLAHSVSSVKELRPVGG